MSEGWPEPMALVEVRWVDSQYHGSGWRTKDEIEKLVEDDLSCRSVGWLYRETEDRLILIQNVSATEEVACTVAIPRAAVTLMRWIESPQVGKPADPAP